jgi:hypothetical protein
MIFLVVSHYKDISIGRVASQARNENLGHAPTRTAIRFSGQGGKMKLFYVGHVQGTQLGV